MSRSDIFLIALGVLVASTIAADATTRARPHCPVGVRAKSTTPLSRATATSGCSTKTSHGYPIPDPACTPGAINKTVTLRILKSKFFKTSCERNVITSLTSKNTTYPAYSTDHPSHNTGKSQVCELDHLVSLELGGADSLDNIWPQCGPDGVELNDRYFKKKDRVENYLALMVQQRRIPLKDAQRGIATDWTQYVDASEAYWKTHTAHGFGSDQ